MKTLIKNGTLIDPANRVNAKLNLLVDGGKIAAVCENEPPADRVIDAAGKVVCPGFIDIHMHEDPVENGRLYDDPERSIFACMLRMGVTTAVGGNCGDSACHPAEYLELCRQKGSWTNVMMLAAHGWFREALTDADKYSPITPAQQKAIAAAMKDALAQGCAGISYGIRYIPGIDHDELYTTAACLQGTGKFLAAHMRDDADAVFAAQQELMDCGKALGIPVQISHIGSMAGFGQMREFLRRADEARLNGLDISCDCYPYAAFSTSLGSTTYDPGWLER
ncbi:MAG: amidohydrolase family protein, partial [Oscillospiraceae bacterium]|nr:amidohydrolase family protein [Oscillospiraceae bacterium]